MLVRLAPGVVTYPHHSHAGAEELHPLAGQLGVDDRKLYPGDYGRAKSGTGEGRVWSEAGRGLPTTTTSAAFFPHFEQRILSANFLSVTDQPTARPSAQTRGLAAIAADADQEHATSAY